MMSEGADRPIAVVAVSGGVDGAASGAAVSAAADNGGDAAVVNVTAAPTGAVGSGTLPQLPMTLMAVALRGRAPPLTTQVSFLSPSSPPIHVKYNNRSKLLETDENS